MLGLRRHLIWDFDGTLYDTYPQMAQAFQAALADLGCSADEQEIYTCIKDTVYAAECAYAARFGIDADALTAAFRKRHGAQTDFPMMPGLIVCLRRTAAMGCRHYLFTHRNRKAVAQLTADGLDGFFADFVTREDGFADKPSPEAILHLMAKHGFGPADAVMIGDREIDMASGRAAGAKCVLLDPDGYYPDAKADARVASLADIPALLQKL